MANTTNCADSATTYRRASPVTPSAATIRAAPAAASQGLPRAAAGGAARCCLMRLSSATTGLGKAATCCAMIADSGPARGTGGEVF